MAYGYNMGVAPVLTNAVAVGVVGYSLVALRADGTVAEWGNSAGDPGVSNLAAIATGWAPGLGLRADGSVTGWGDDYHGALTGIPVGFDQCRGVGSGVLYRFCRARNGTVAAWGDNDYQLLDLPDVLTNVVAIAAGNDGSTALALRADGTVVEWNYSLPTHIPKISNAVAVATANAYQNAVLLFDGSVTVWPTGEYYEPVPDGFLTNIVAVAGAGSHMLALHNNGTVIPWGCDCRSDFASTTNLTNVNAIAAGGGDGYDYSIFLINYTNLPPVLAAGEATASRASASPGNGSATTPSKNPPTSVRRPTGPSNKTSSSRPRRNLPSNLSPVAGGNARFYRARLMP